VVGASLAGASSVPDIDDAISTMGEAAHGETGRVCIGTLFSTASGFLCAVITTFRLQHADVRVDAADEGSPEQASKRGGRMWSMYVGTRLFPNGCGTTLGGARRCSSSYRHTLSKKDAIEWSMLRGEN